MTATYVLSGEDIDVINAALFMAAKELDASPFFSRFGGGERMREVQNEIFGQIAVRHMHEHIAYIEEDGA